MALILVVEDVPAVLLSLRLILQGSGHTVTGAPDGAAGLSLMQGTKFDLVITDIWMPRSSGAEVIQAGRAHSPKTRFLAITGGDPNSRQAGGEPHAQDYGADRVLFKPFEKQDLLSAVTQLLAAA